jgi:general secretion pathway protein E
MSTPAPLDSRPPSPAAADERIAAALLGRGRLKDADLVRAQRLQADAGGSLGTLLVRLGLVSERDMAEAASEVLGLPLVSAKDCPEAPPENLPLTLRFLKQQAVVPVGEDAFGLDLLVADPQDPYAADAVRLATGRAVRVRIGLRSEIADLIERYYGQGRSAMGTIVENIGDDTAGDEDDVEHLRDLASEAPVIRLVNLVIQRAVELRASDIHIEPFENRLKVRYRVDGVLEEAESPPANLTAAVISRIKIMAKLNIAERRLPQDGRIMVRVQG